MTTDCYACIEFGPDPHCHCQQDPYGTKHLTDKYKRGEHVMGKTEASLMRRIQSDTGMTEEQVRLHKKYRKMLSDTQTHQGPGKSRGARAAIRLLKRITKEHKLSAAHPEVIEAAMEAARAQDRDGWQRWTYYGRMAMHMRNLLEYKNR